MERERISGSRQGINEGYGEIWSKYITYMYKMPWLNPLLHIVKMWQLKCSKETTEKKSATYISHANQHGCAVASGSGILEAKCCLPPQTPTWIDSPLLQILTITMSWWEFFEMILLGDLSSHEHYFVLRMKYISQSLFKACPLAIGYFKRWGLCGRSRHLRGLIFPQFPLTLCFPSTRS